MQKTCVCGATIPNRGSLCKDCLSIYGTDKDLWPEWLKFMIADMDRESQYERRHSGELSYELLVDADIEDRLYVYQPQKPVTALRGCRTETHLYEDREKY
jgi:hypothetical protein